MEDKEWVGSPFNFRWEVKFIIYVGEAYVRDRNVCG
jgi:hypothetical protein